MVHCLCLGQLLNLVFELKKIRFSMKQVTGSNDINVVFKLLKFKNNI